MTSTAFAAAPPPSAPSPDPVAALRFTVQIPGVLIGRFTECAGIGVEYQTMEYHEGGQNAFVHKLRGPVRHRNLVLKRGVTSEDALQRWFHSSQHLRTRPTLSVTLLAPDGAAVRQWDFEHAFPVRWAGPSLNAGAGALATEELEVAHRGLVTGAGRA